MVNRKILKFPHCRADFKWGRLRVENDVVGGKALMKSFNSQLTFDRQSYWEAQLMLLQFRCHRCISQFLLLFLHLLSFGILFFFWARSIFRHFSEVNHYFWLWSKSIRVWSERSSWRPYCDLSSKISTAYSLFQARTPKYWLCQIILLDPLSMKCELGRELISMASALRTLQWNLRKCHFTELIDINFARRWINSSLEYLLLARKTFSLKNAEEE